MYIHLYLHLSGFLSCRLYMRDSSDFDIILSWTAVFQRVLHIAVYLSRHETFSRSCTLYDDFNQRIRDSKIIEEYVQQV